MTGAIYAKGVCKGYSKILLRPTTVDEPNNHGATYYITNEVVKRE